MKIRAVSNRKTAIPIILLAALFAFSSFPAQATEQSQANQAKYPKIKAPVNLTKILPGFQRYAEHAMAAWGVPGLAIAVVSGQDIVLAKGFGVRTKGGRQPVNRQTVFQIGSLSKAFTAALIGRLVDEGRLNWDDKVADLLPGFAMARPWVGREMMVWDLMAQHSGLETQAASALPLFGYGPNQITAALRYLEPVTSFRSAYAYQNSLFLVAGQIIEKYYGASWPEMVSRLIFKPLGMKDSSADRAGFFASANRISLHRPAGGTPSGPVAPVPADWPFHDWVYSLGPAGGINSSVLDMAAWLKLQIGRGSYGRYRLLKKPTAEFIQAPKTIIKGDPYGERTFYSLGWVLSETSPEPLIWHTGGTLGCSTIIAFAPESKVGLVVLTNLVGVDLPRALARRFFNQLQGRSQKDWSRELLARRDELIKNNPAPERPADPRLPLDINRYVGEYSNPVYGRISLVREGGSLAAVIGPKKVKLPLKPWERDTFQASLPGLMDDFGFVTFTVSPSGWAGEVVFEALDRGRAGRFTRIKPGPVDKTKRVITIKPKPGIKND